MQTTKMTITIHSEGDNHAATIATETGECVGAAFGKTPWDAVSNAAIFWNNREEGERNPESS